jgi:predicted enzyme related to lactoylglutathione lyase
VGKARAHLDITVPDLEMAIRSVAELGGWWTGDRHDYDEGAVAVMTDPEGSVPIVDPRR